MICVLTFPKFHTHSHQKIELRLINMLYHNEWDSWADNICPPRPQCLNYIQIMLPYRSSYLALMIQVCSVVIPPLVDYGNNHLQLNFPLKFGCSHALTCMLNLLHLGVLTQLYPVGGTCSTADISCTPYISWDIYIYHASIHQSTYVLQL